MTGWLVRSPALPDAVIPVADEAAARAEVDRCRAVCSGHRVRVLWEYGMWDPAEPGSYRRIGPR